MNILQTIEADLAAAGKWLESEAEVAAHSVWDVMKTVFVQNEPAIVNDVVIALKDFLPTVAAEVATGAPFADLEQGFVMWALREGRVVLADVEKLGSVTLQALIGLTIKAIQTPIAPAAA